jgi:hypothetical protein
MSRIFCTGRELLCTLKTRAPASKDERLFVLPYDRSGLVGSVP